MSFRILAGTSIGALLISMSLPTYAQTQPSPPEQVAFEETVSAEEVTKFARAIRQMRSIQTQAQQQATQVLEAANLSIAQFNDLVNRQRHPESHPTAAMTRDEQLQFERTFPRIASIRATTEQQMEQAIESEGLAVQRFNQIFSLVQQNPRLRRAVEQVLQRLNAPELS